MWGRVPPAREAVSKPWVVSGFRLRAKLPPSLQLRRTAVASAEAVSRTLRVLKPCLAIALITVRLQAQGEVIDRVMAVVAGEIITQSDVEGAMALGLVSTSGAPLGAALQRLIERALTLREVRRYGPGDPSDQAVEQRLQTIRQQFSAPAAFAQALARSGMDEARLREFVRDEFRIQAYLDARFASPAPLTDEDLMAYYQEHLADFARAGRVLPLTEVRDAVRQRLDAQRRKAMIDDWLAGLRRRADVRELYLPGR